MTVDNRLKQHMCHSWRVTHVTVKSYSTSTNIDQDICNSTIVLSDLLNNVTKILIHKVAQLKLGDRFMEIR